MGILKKCSYVSKSRNTYLSEDEKTGFIDELGFHFNMERGWDLRILVCPPRLLSSHSLFRKWYQLKHNKILYRTCH